MRKTLLQTIIDTPMEIWTVIIANALIQMAFAILHLHFNKNKHIVSRETRGDDNNKIPSNCIGCEYNGIDNVCKHCEYFVK